ncbi:MAG TPA: glycoside hydrolase family 130 protein [Acidobacteriaceae bacterium]|nr:glycoside hydrolase family 130 protein [Acidobacteriaceae bacterium]
MRRSPPVVAAIFCVAMATAFSASTFPHWMLGPFTRPANDAPVITPKPSATFHDPLRAAPVHWEAQHTFNPAAIVRNGKVFVLYRAEDDTGKNTIGMHTSRLGLATSDDGIHFTQSPEPVFYAAKDAQMSREWPGGVEDPRIVQAEDGTYVLTYTQWNRKTYDIGIATSKDLLHWTKYGPAFGSTGKYANLRYKSAGILTRLDGDHLVAAKLQGRYWMYWGEGYIGLATSNDLIHWNPMEGADGKPLVLLAPRAGRFDSALPEVGPPALLTKNGILLIYNGKNGGHAAIGADGKAALAPDLSLPSSTYSVGQTLFSATNPAQPLKRTNHPFFKPEMPFERSGQYAAGTTFAEGLVFFHGKWHLYYGCADSLVGVAVANPSSVP